MPALTDPAELLREHADAASGIQRELESRIVELTEAVAARDTFIAVAAHELRNPMTPMIGQVELLLAGVRARRYTPAQLELRLHRICKVMNHYIRRTTALLDVSRITSGNLKLEPTSFDLCEVIQNTVYAFAEAAAQANSPITMHLPPALTGTWDQLAMEQIIDNLISNAIKYGARRPVEVRANDLVSAVNIQIRDHGPGISLTDRNRIFEKFERAVGPAEGRTGFGVGLWVVGQVVHAMDGSISVDDAPGGGSLFSVTLPRHIAAHRS